jgi:hypothetical protein
MAIRLPFKPSKAAQAAVAVLSAVSVVGVSVLHSVSGFLSPDWAAAITSGLAVVAAVAGFIRTAEPIIDDFDKYAAP